MELDDLVALIRDGDVIEIDIPARTLNVKLSAEELQSRTPAEPQSSDCGKSGYLAKYKVLATSADTGGVLRW
jgi:dihydroxyacid dehydratase/phosphogluconate dehydratase